MKCVLHTSPFIVLQPFLSSVVKPSAISIAFPLILPSVNSCASTFCCRETNIVVKEYSNFLCNGKWNKVRIHGTSIALTILKIHVNVEGNGKNILFQMP